MSKVKLVIEMPEPDYLWIKNHVMTVNEQIIASGKLLGDVLDKIRAEIDEIPLSEPMVSADGLYCYGSKSITMGHFREKVFEIIDKYRERSE